MVQGVCWCYVHDWVRHESFTCVIVPHQSLTRFAFAFQVHSCNGLWLCSGISRTQCLVQPWCLHSLVSLRASLPGQYRTKMSLFTRFVFVNFLVCTAIASFPKFGQISITSELCRFALFRQLCCPDELSRLDWWHLSLHCRPHLDYRCRCPRSPSHCSP